MDIEFLENSLDTVLDKFQIKGRRIVTEQLKNGHINYSYNRNEYWWDALNIEWNEEE